MKTESSMCANLFLLSLTCAFFSLSVAAGAADSDADPSFSPGSGAFSQYPAVTSLDIQPDGQILAGGNFTSFNLVPRNNLVRLTSDGAVDSGFDPGTGTDREVSRVLRQDDGRIILVGIFSTYNGTPRRAIARVDSTGQLEATYDPGSRYGPGTRLDSATLQSDGKLLVWSGAKYTPTGDALPYVERINIDGTLDATFHASGVTVNNAVSAVVEQPDGKLLVAGNFLYNGSPKRNIVRLYRDGSHDPSFMAATDQTTDPTILAIGLQADGKILIGGEIERFGGMSRNGIARLKEDGSLDQSFDPGTGMNSWVASIDIQSDGRILLGGSFSRYNGIRRLRLARVNPDGSLDATFDPVIGASDTVLDTAFQKDGKIMIGGIFNSYNNIQYHGIARLHSAAPVFSTWVASHFLPGEADTLGQPGADPDGDGMSNLLEYFTGANPRAGSASPLEITPHEGLAAVGFRHFERPDVAWNLEVSTDQADWQPLPPGSMLTSGPQSDGRVNTIVALANSRPSHFLRARVTKVTPQ